MRSTFQTVDVRIGVIVHKTVAVDNACIGLKLHTTETSYYKL